MNPAAVSHLRRLGLALVLGLFALWATVGAALAACQTVGAAFCGPIRFEGAPSANAVGVQVGSTCTQPGTTDYQVTLSGPDGFSRVLAQGSVSTDVQIVPMQVIKVPKAGEYSLTVTTTANQGETGGCVTGTTVRTVKVPAQAKPTPKPTPSPSPTPEDTPTPRPTKEPTEPPAEEITEAPTDQPAEEVTEAPTEVPAESASEGPATFEPNPSVDAGGSPAPTPGSGGGGTGSGGGPDLMTMVLVGVILVGGVGAAAAALLYVRQNRVSADAPWRAGPWKCARCNAINREGSERCRRCYARWDGTP